MFIWTKRETPKQLTFPIQQEGYMDRRTEIKQYLLPYRVEWMNERVEKAAVDIKCSIKEELFPVLQEMAEAIITKQKQRKTEECAYLLICFLRSSIVTGSHEYMAILSDQTLYLDENREERYWCPKQLYNGLKEDALQAVKRVTGHFIRVSDYEKEFVQRLIEEDYISFIETGLVRRLEEIQKLEPFQQMKKTGSFQCFFGEYMGDVKQL